MPAFGLLPAAWQCLPWSSNEMQTSSPPIPIAISWQTSFVFLMEACHPPCVCSSCSAPACAMVYAACSTHAVPGHAAAITPATAAHTVVLDSRRHELSEASCQRRKAASYGSSKPTLQHADLTCSERHCSRLEQRLCWHAASNTSRPKPNVPHH